MAPDPQPWLIERILSQGIQRMRESAAATKRGAWKVMGLDRVHQRIFGMMEDAGMDQSTYRQEQLSKLRELIKDIQVAMLTTADDYGSLRSRPMATPQVAFDGDLWFFTWLETTKVEDLQRHPQVNVSFADPERQHYVSVSGPATLVHDRQKMEELWSAWFRTWFPRGLDDPNLALLRVQVEQAEYWDAPSSTMVQLFGVVKATLTGQPPQPGEHAKLLVDERQSGP